MKTVEAYRRERVSLYFIIITFLIMIAAGLVASFLIQYANGIALSDLFIVYGIGLLVVVAPMLWLWRYAFRKWQYNLKMENAFRERGKLVEAAIISKDEREISDGTDYFIIYQFTPDFKVLAKDDTWGLRFWSKPIGSKISVKILPEDSTQTTIDFK